MVSDKEHEIMNDGGDDSNKLFQRVEAGIGRWQAPALLIDSSESNPEVQMANMKQLLTDSPLDYANKVAVVVGGNSLGKSLEMERIIHNLRDRGVQVYMVPDNSSSMAPYLDQLQTLYENGDLVAQLDSFEDLRQRSIQSYKDFSLNTFPKVPDFSNFIELREPKWSFDVTEPHGWKPNKFHTAADPFKNFSGTYSRKRPLKKQRKNRK